MCTLVAGDGPLGSDPATKDFIAFPSIVQLILFQDRLCAVAVGARFLPGLMCVAVVESRGVCTCRRHMMLDLLLFVTFVRSYVLTVAFLLSPRAALTRIRRLRSTFPCATLPVVAFKPTFPLISLVSPVQAFSVFIFV